MKRGGPIRRRTPLKRTEVRWKHRPRPGLAQARKFVRGRSGGWCEANTPDCPPGRHRGGQAHHVLMRSQGGTDDPGNLLWVCADGHTYVHAHVAESYQRGWLRRRAG